MLEWLVETSTLLGFEYLKILLSAFVSISRFFAPYLAVAILFAAIIYYKRGIYKEKSFLSYLLPLNIYKHRSTKIDLYIILLSPIFIVLLVLPITSVFIHYTHNTILFVMKTLPFNIHAEQNIQLMVVFSIFWLLCFDFAQFITHYLQHKIPFLWEFHKIHHSADVLNPMTAYRFHPIDILLVSINVAIFTGIASGTFEHIFSMQVKPYEIMHLHVGIFLFYLLGYNLRHSHIWLSYPHAVEHILSSPAQHQIHHSAEKKHWDKNMGFIFSFWDWIFGTLYVADKPEKFILGLSLDKDTSYHSIWNIYLLPFKNLLGLNKKNIPATQNNIETSKNEDIEEKKVA